MLLECRKMQKKTSWGTQVVEFLCFLLGTDGYNLLPFQVQGIVDMLPPKNAKQVRQFLGLANFIKNQIPCKTEVFVPITKLTKKNQPWVWGEEQQKAFVEIKVKVAQSVCLIFPKLSISFHFYPDACEYQMGAMLIQEHGVTGCFS